LRVKLCLRVYGVLLSPLSKAGFRLDSPRHGQYLKEKQTGDSA